MTPDRQERHVDDSVPNRGIWLEDGDENEQHVEEQHRTSPTKSAVILENYVNQKNAPQR